MLMISMMQIRAVRSKLTCAGKRWLIFVCTVFCLVLATTEKSRALSPVETQAAAASAPVALNTAEKVVSIVALTGQVIKLPLGLLEVALSPLPVLTVKEGCKLIGSGLMAPLKALAATVRLPFDVLHGLNERLL